MNDPTLEPGQMELLGLLDVISKRAAEAAQLVKRKSSGAYIEDQVRTAISHIQVIPLTLDDAKKGMEEFQSTKEMCMSMVEKAKRDQEKEAIHKTVVLCMYFNSAAYLFDALVHNLTPIKDWGQQRGGGGGEPPPFLRRLFGDD